MNSRIKTAALTLTAMAFGLLAAACKQPQPQQESAQPVQTQQQPLATGTTAQAAPSAQPQGK